MTDPDPPPAVLAAVISCTDRAIPTPRQAQEGEMNRGTVPPEAYDETHPDHDHWVNLTGRCFSDHAHPTAPSPVGQAPAGRSEADLIERVADVLAEHRRRQVRVCSCGWVDLTVPASVTWEQHTAAAAVEVLRGEGR